MPNSVFTVGPLVFPLSHNELQKMWQEPPHDQSRDAQASEDAPFPLDQSDRSVAF